MTSHSKPGAYPYWMASTGPMSGPAPEMAAKFKAWVAGLPDKRPSFLSEEQFDEVLTAAIRRVVGVQFPEGEVELVPRGAVYAFKDPALEGLSVAEKQVLRMGAKSGGVLQRQLREFAARAKLNVTLGAR